MQINLAEIHSGNFEQRAIEVFRYQYVHNPIYSDYCKAILKKEVAQIEDIPFLPISFFKSHKVSCFFDQEYSYFESSGTSGQLNSKHYYKSLDNYYQSIELAFKYFFEDKKYTIVGLLPHYLERQHSSLVAMVRYWMKMNGQEEYFFLDDFEKLSECIEEHAHQHILLIGISFALLDFADYVRQNTKLKIQNSKLNIIETGGMKGTRQEMPKIDLIRKIKDSFPYSKIISEYGMCELFSQAYSDEALWFSCPPWMRVLIGDINDPLSNLEQGRGTAKIIDLANINSCSFIETQDLIELKSNGKFQILGRVHEADVRGCSLMYN